MYYSVIYYVVSKLRTWKKNQQISHEIKFRHNTYNKDLMIKTAMLSS